MTIKQQLNTCNSLLLTAFLFIIATVTALLLVDTYTPWLMWAHVIVGIIFVGISYWHLRLNLGTKNRLQAFRRKSPGLRILTYVALLGAVSGVAAFVRGFIPPYNPMLQTIHSWIGYIFILIAIIHLSHHHTYYTK